MMRLSSLDSHGGLISICPSTSTDEQSPRGYGTQYQKMVAGYEEDATIVNEYTGNGHVGFEEDATRGNGHEGLSEKKRRLNVEQVKALEKNFELENKLEPERKVKLAQELGLQPRQVAVWFQNRRARWKTKQIEKDYSILKDQYDTLRLSFDSLRRDNDTLLREIAKLKAKLIGEEDNNSTESDISIKEEEISLLDHKTLEQKEPSSPPPLLESSRYLNYRSFTDIRDLRPNAAPSSSSAAAAPSSSSAAAAVAEAGLSDSSDSSVVVNDESSSTEREAPATFSGCNFHYVKMEQTEEHNDFLSEEEAYGFFSDEQPPSLHWYSAADHWT